MIYLTASQVVAFIYYLVIIYRFYEMEMANETVQFWRQLQLWSAIIGGIVTCITVIIAAYSQHKINSLESENKSTVSDTTHIHAETVILNKGNKNKTNVTMGDTYNVKSNNQTGGITAGKIEKVIISDEGDINPMENFVVQTDDNLTFRVKPKSGKWIQPFFMIPRAEKDSCQFTVDTASGQSFDLYMGVEEEANGMKLYGAIFGLGSAVPNPATKDFHYSISFNKAPSFFVFGDHASGRAFMWKKN